jgi:hypothetical protein
MERHGHLQLAPEIRGGLLSMSAATIDRALQEIKGQAGGRLRRRAAPSSAVRRSVPVRTFADWDDPAPGFVEADLVAPSAPTLAQFLLGLRTSWQEGEVRPTNKPKKKVTQYWRRCPDPLESVTTQMREWFEAEPWRTSRELLERLQAEHPGIYQDGQLRTVQRRLKVWRRKVAHTGKGRRLSNRNCLSFLCFDSDTCALEVFRPLRHHRPSLINLHPRGNRLTLRNS